MQEIINSFRARNQKLFASRPANSLKYSARNPSLSSASAEEKREISASKLGLNAQQGQVQSEATKVALHLSHSFIS